MFFFWHSLRANRHLLVIIFGIKTYCYERSHRANEHSHTSTKVLLRVVNKLGSSHFDDDEKIKHEKK